MNYIFREVFIGIQSKVKITIKFLCFSANTCLTLLNHTFLENKLLTYDYFILYFILMIIISWWRCKQSADYWEVKMKKRKVDEVEAEQIEIPDVPLNEGNVFDIQILPDVPLRRILDFLSVREVRKLRRLSKG